MSARRERSEAARVHAQICEHRELANFDWDLTGELVVVQVPAQRRERAEKSMEAVRSEVSARRGRREGQAGRGAQPCACPHSMVSPVSWPNSVGIGPVSWLLFNILRSVA